MELNRTYLATSWRSWLSHDARVGPEWLHLVWTLIFAMGIAAAFTVLGFAMYASGDGAWRNWAGWSKWYGINLVLALCIGFAIHGLFRLLVPWVGLARIRAFSGPQRALFFGGVPMLGVALGWPIGGLLVNQEGFGWFRLGNTNAVVGSVLLGLLINFVIYQLFRARARQASAEKQAVEARLRLLQAQIEPHFLFNTLANVSSLIDHDAAKAKRMLETFTDYLRCSLTSLRRERATLGSELDLVQAYLELLKVRMEDRLQFSIVGGSALRDAQLPSLMLQPLVENAIHHGLEPQLEGGQVHVSVRRDEQHLVLEVADDGMGLQAPSRRRGGAGLALANLRERLVALYGDRASLTLSPAHPGALATLRVPYEAQSTP